MVPNGRSPLSRHTEVAGATDYRLKRLGLVYQFPMTAGHRINDHRASRLDELLPWNWKAWTATLAG
jgi:hypothetical protein